MDRQPRTLGIAGQLRSALASLPPARGLLPLILLLLIWQLVQPGPSPYFPGPSQWWTATLTLFSREHLVAAFGATTWTFLKGLAAGDRRRHGSRPAGRDLGPCGARAAAAA